MIDANGNVVLPLIADVIIGSNNGAFPEYPANMVYLAEASQSQIRATLGNNGIDLERIAKSGSTNSPVVCSNEGRGPDARELVSLASVIERLEQMAEEHEATGAAAGLLPADVLPANLLPAGLRAKLSARAANAGRGSDAQASAKKTDELKGWSEEAIDLAPPKQVASVINLLSPLLVADAVSPR